mgnify:CR=1 FL=1|jgi:hypothetical protein
MKPFKIDIYVYADSEEMALAAQNAINKFVKDKYQSGILVTAEKLTNALTRFGSSMIVNQFLK